MKKNDDLPIEKQMFRYWVELRDLRDGRVRTLPVTFIRRILLKAKGKDKAPETPDEIRVRVEDGERIWDARNRDDLSRQLGAVYPDGKFERTLKCERDLEAEGRYQSAINGLVRIIAEAVAEDVLAAEANNQRMTQEERTALTRRP